MIKVLPAEKGERCTASISQIDASSEFSQRTSLGTDPSVELPLPFSNQGLDALAKARNWLARFGRVKGKMNIGAITGGLNRCA